MSPARRFAFLLLPLGIGSVLLPAPSRAAQQMACSTTVSSRSCGLEVKVGDAEKPCIERDGKAYCPVYRTYYPATTA